MIRPGTEADAAALADFARRSFVATYGAYNTPRDMGEHLKQSFGPDIQAAELRDAAAARASGADTLWLSVWQRNPRAVRFNEKCGFTRAGTQVFPLGADRQDDWLMTRDIST